VLKLIEKEIRNGNPWYTESQLKQIVQPHTKRIIEGRWQFISKEIRRQFEKTNRDLALIDIGCGDGVNLELLTKIKGLNITAVDYNRIRTERLRKRFTDIKIIHADIFTHPFNTKFDIVLMSQVLEHIENDYEALVKVRGMLRRQGILILGVPNEGCLMAQLRNRIIQPCISKTTDHVNFYTKRQIVNLIREAGYTVQSIYYEGFFFPHLRLNQLINSYKVGYYITKILGKIFRSQIGGFYFVLQLK